MRRKLIGTVCGTLWAVGSVACGIVDGPNEGPSGSDPALTFFGGDSAQAVNPYNPPQASTNGTYQVRWTDPDVNPQSVSLPFWNSARRTDEPKYYDLRIDAERDGTFVLWVENGKSCSKIRPRDSESDPQNWVTLAMLYPVAEGHGALTNGVKTARCANTSITCMEYNIADDPCAGGLRWFVADYPADPARHPQVREFGANGGMCEPLAQRFESVHQKWFDSGAWTAAIVHASDNERTWPEVSGEEWNWLVEKSQDEKWIGERVKLGNNSSDPNVIKFYSKRQAAWAIKLLPVLLQRFVNDTMTQMMTHVCGPQQ